MKLTRRSVLRHSAAAALAAPALGGLAAGSRGGARRAERKWRHGLSLFGEPHYPAGFKHFDYVNPAAPKGGVVREIAFGTFDNFNQVIAGVKGNLAQGIELFCEALTAGAMDEVSTEYGLLAEAASYPDDYSSVTYRHARQCALARRRAGDRRRRRLFLRHVSRKTARSLPPITGTSPRRKRPASARSPSPSTVRAIANCRRSSGSYRCCRSTGGKAPTRSGKKRDVTQTTLEPPLGSGPYRLKEFVPGRSIVYEKVADYWGKDLNVNVGANNFQEIRYEYFRDSTVALEAFKGDQVDWRTENSAKNWATAYDFPAVRDGRVIKEEFPIRNLRRSCRPSPSTSAATSSRTRGCAAPSISPSTSTR